MSELYVAIANAVPSGTALKTILAIATAASDRAELIEWGVTFDSVAASAVPVEARLQRQSTAGTGGAALAANYGPNPQNVSSPAPSATALKGPAGTWTAEPTAGAILRAVLVPPTSGYCQQFPLGQEPKVPVSSWLGIVVTAAANVNVTAYMVWAE
jgi:hypothetical protein